MAGFFDGGKGDEEKGHIFKNDEGGEVGGGDGVRFEK